MARDVTDLLQRARDWAEDDPDPQTTAELRTLLIAVERGDADARADLEDRFDGTLEFGTAGLRGQLGAGPNRMNRVVVGRAAAGLAAYLKAQGEDGGPVVIGYDARFNSATFATDTAEILAGAGFQALLLPHPLPTPVLAYAIRKLGCVAGVMVTASHNPAPDNGYKVYLGDGSQIVPPADEDIAAAIGRVGNVSDPSDVPRSEDYRTLDEAVTEDYLERALTLVNAAGARELDTVYTPMHGVGGGLVTRLLQRAGFAPPAVVDTQAEPDPEFPTVEFPNPEEPGALDLAYDLAERTGAELILANDPDADRCAVAVPLPEGGWRRLSGDEVGALLADHLLRTGSTGTFASSIVSSSQLAEIAAAAEQPHVATLTGFKWIGRLPGLAFGYEEALGYCVDPAAVGDKDGITALLRIVELAAELRAAGQTIQDRLDQIALRYGVFDTAQISIRVTDLGQTTELMDGLVRNPPEHLGGLVVERVDDLSAPSDGLPPTTGVRFRLAGSGRLERARVIVRPSGTEPKLKCYLETVVLPGEHRNLEADRAVAREQLEILRSELVGYLG